MSYNPLDMEPVRVQPHIRLRRRRKAHKTPYKLNWTLLSVLLRRARTDLAVDLIFYVHDPCPKCGKRLTHAVIEKHSTRHDFAVRNVYCAECGPVETTMIPLKPGKTTRESEGRTGTKGGK